MDEDEEYSPSKHEDISDHEILRPRERSITPFLRSQGPTDGRGLIFNSRISPSPMRTTGGAKRRRRQKHLSSAASPDSPLSPRNLTREFAAMNTSSESDSDIKLTASTPLLQPSQKPAKRISRKSANLPTPVFSAVDSVRNNGIATNSSSTQEKSRQYTKSIDTTDNYVKKRTVETFEEYSRIVTTKSSQNTEKRDKFSTPPRNEALLDVSSLKGSPKLLFWKGETWERSPRTGYTYAKSLTYRDTVTPGRDDPMPHMARWPLYYRGQTLKESDSIRTDTQTQAFQEKLSKKTLLSEFSDDESLNLEEYRVLSAAPDRPPSWSSWARKQPVHRPSSFTRITSYGLTGVSSFFQIIKYFITSILFATTYGVKTGYHAVKQLSITSYLYIYQLLLRSYLAVQHLFIAIGTSLRAAILSVPGSSNKLVSAILFLLLWLCSLPVVAAKSVGSAVQYSYSSVSTTLIETWIRTKSAFATFTSRTQSRQATSTTSTSPILSQEETFTFTSEAITSSMEQSPDIAAVYTHTPSVFNDKVNWRQDHQEASYDTIDDTQNNGVDTIKNVTDSSASFWQSFLFLFTLFSSITSVKATSTDKIENDNEDSLKKTTIFGSLNIFKGLKSLLRSKKKKKTGRYSNLRRSRRLAGLPPEIVEELRKARRMRRIERQISSGGTANDDIQDDNIPDQDDEELLEQILQQKEAEEDCEIEDHGHIGSLIASVVLLPVTVISSSWSFVRSFFKSSKSTGIRRSRRLRGLPPEIIAELKKARKMRRMQQNQSEDSDIDDNIIDNNDTLDEHDEKIIEQFLQSQDFEIEDHGHFGHLITSILTFPFTALNKFWKCLTTRTKSSKYGELRRSRRLQGLPAEIIEELKQARRQRRIERQISSGMNATIEDDTVPDQDDDILIEEILTRKENEEINSSKTLMSKIMSIVLLPFPFINWLYHYIIKKTKSCKYAELRRSRRLQGLPAEIIDELKIARRRRRLERQFSGEAMDDSILDDSIPDIEDELLIDEILTRKEQEELEKATFGTLIKSVVLFPIVSISSMLKRMSTSRTDTRRSRRLQGLPPHIYEELQATKRQRRSARLQNKSNGDFISDLDNELSQNEENEIIDQLLIKHNVTESEIVKESFLSRSLSHLTSFIFLPLTLSQSLWSRMNGKSKKSTNYDLENLPTEILEKLQTARRQRRIERQKLHGEGGDILTDNMPDQDDNELLEQIINEYEHIVPKQSYLLGAKPFDNQPINATAKITGFLSSFYTWIFSNTTMTGDELELRRSRRLQGLPPDVLEELMNARRQRRILRQKVDPNYVIEDDNIPDSEDDTLLAQIIADKEYVVPKEAKLLGMTENVNTSSDYLTEDEEYQVNETEYHSRTDQWKIITVFTSVFIWLKSWFVASKAKEPLRRSARLRGKAAEIGGGLNSNGTKPRGKSLTDNLECLSDDDNEMDENDEDFNTVVRVPLRDRIALLFSRIFASIGMYRSDPISGKMSHENTQGTIDKQRGRSEMSSSSGYNTDEDSLDIHQSEYNYNQASILSSVFYDVKDLTLRKRIILPHSSSSKQFKFDERIMYRTKDNSSIISKEKDNRNLIKLLALLAFLSLACIFFFIPLTINTETQFLENSRQIISNATNHFQQWTSDNLVKLNPRKLLNKEILYLPLTLASNAANAIHSGFMQLGNGFWTLSTALGQSLNIVVNFTARCLQSILEIFLLPLSWIPTLPDITSIEIFTVPGKVFGLTFEFLKGSFNFVGNGIYSLTFLGLNVTSNAMSSSFSIITSGAENTVELLTSGISRTCQYMVQGFTSTGELIKSGFGSTASVLSSNLGALGDSLVLLAQNSVSGFVAVFTKCGELFASSFAIMYENVINIFSSFSINTWNLATGKMSEVGHKVMEDLVSGWQATSGWILSVWMSTSEMGKQAGNSVYSGITTIFTGSNNAVTGIAEQTWRLGGQSIHNIQQLIGQSVHYAGQLILNFVDFLVLLMVAILELFMSLFAFCWSFVSGLFNFGFSGVRDSGLELVTRLTGIAATVWSRIVNLPWYSKQPPIEAPNYETIVENILTNTKFLQSLKEVSNGNAKFDDTNLIKELKLIEESYNEKANLQLEVFRSELQEIKDKLNVLTSNEATAKDKTEADMLALKARLDNLASTINIRADTLATKSNEDKQEFDKIKVKLTGIEDQLITLETQLTELHASVQNCCQNRTEIEDMINKVINETFNDTNTNPMLDLLAKYFVTKPELQQVFHNVDEAKLKINEDVKSMLESNANIYNREKIVEELLVQLQQKSTESSQGTTEKPAMNVLNELEVKSIVEQALLQYDADKTGLFDYALETAGGSVVSTRCTETYVQKSGMYSIFGIPIWYPSNNPRTVIQPGVLPGECWAFKGSAGFIVIQLSEPITPFQFSLEHISKSMSPSGRIDSAPREFSVYGLQTQKDTEPVKLGDYVYLEDGNPLQFFQVQVETDQTFPYIELDVNSNYGNLNYTCIYRFRVHGHTGPK